MPDHSSRLLSTQRSKHLSHSATLRSNPYSATNRDAVINLSVAENVLCLPELSAALQSHEPKELLPALANFLSRGYTVRKDDLAITPGATVGTDALMHVLCSRGETVLLPAPGYAAFKRDVSTRSGVRVAKYRQFSGDDAIQNIEESLTDDTKVVVVVNPTNPDGMVLDASTIRAIAEWARRGVHVLFDEAYACSVYRGKFVGVFDVMQGKLGHYVHVLYTLSKDFGVSGARIGVIHSQNAAVLSAVRGVAEVAGVCEYTMRIFGGLLADQGWVEAYLKECRTRLKVAYEVVTGVLKELRIPFVEPCAGVFVWADMTEFEESKRIWEQLYDGGVLVTPGEDCWGGAGWCRICFASVDMEGLLVAMQRFRNVVIDIRISCR